MSDPYYLGRLTKMNNRLLETIEANKKKKGYTVNEMCIRDSLQPPYASYERYTHYASLRASDDDEY